MRARPETSFSEAIRAHRAAGFGLLALAAFLFAPLSAFAQARRPEEVKAAFLYNFARFVEWPARAFDSPESPFIIAIVADEAVVAELQSMVKNEKVRNRPVVVRSGRRVRDTEGCHVLYLGTADGARLDEFLEVTRGRAVLTVGDASDFLREGGVVQFVTERTIRLRIDLRNARRANLTISSQLLRLAEIENK